MLDASTSYGAGSYDVWLLMLDSLGNVAWQKTYGREGKDVAHHMAATHDGNIDLGFSIHLFYPYSEYSIELATNKIKEPGISAIGFKYGKYGR